MKFDKEWMRLCLLENEYRKNLEESDTPGVRLGISDIYGEYAILEKEVRETNHDTKRTL